MADSFVQLNNDGPGKKIDTRTENVNGDHRQVMVIGDPITNANVANVTAAGGVQVDGSGVTQPISASSLPLPSGAATSANQSTAQSTLATIASNTSQLATTQPISASSLPLPTGAATSANQTTGNNSLSTLVTNTPPVGQTTMAASSPVVIASNQSSVPVTVGNFPATQPISGTVTANAGSGTFAVSAVSLPLPTGAATAANQTSVIGSASGGGASASSLLSGGQFNTVLPTLTNTQQAAIQLDSSARAIIAPLTSTSTVTVVQPTAANLNATVSGTVTTTPPSNASTNVTQFGGVNISTGTGASGTGIPRITVANDSNILATQSGTWTVQPGNTANTTPWLTTISQGGNSATVNATNELLTTDTDLTLAQASTTSGQLGPLIQGAVTTAAPTYTTAQTNPLSLTTAGALRTDASATTQPVSGTVTANQGTANATPWNENIAQIAGVTTSTAASGVIKTGITGNTAATLDAVITAATAPANGLAILTVAQTTAPSLTTGQSVAVQCDYQGSAFVKPYRRGQTVSKATTIAASTTATTVLAAQAAGIFADISTLVITPTGAATATVFTCTLSDGTNSYIFDMDTGTTAGSAGQGVNISFNPPLPATTAATAWTIANSSATPTVHITVVAVLQKAS